jgi:hypothetical protein
VKPVALIALMAGAGILASCAQETSVPSELQMRRITEQQYVNTIHDIFGPEIRTDGLIEPIIRRDGLIATGATKATVTRAGFEHFDALAQSVASQVLAKDAIAKAVPCKPQDKAKSDDACAKKFVIKLGSRLFRRPLLDTEVKPWVDAAHVAAERSGDFYDGLEFTLAAMLVAPEFLFIVDDYEDDPENPGKVRATAYSKASRLSYLFWNSAPDDELLARAADGSLHEPGELSAQIDRLIGSPKFERGVRELFGDMFHLEDFDALAKDPALFPAFGSEAVRDSREQIMRMVIDNVITNDADYRDLYTTRQIFMTRALGRVYGMPVAARRGWDSYELPDGDPRAGIVSQVGFLAAHAHPGRSSATLRGKAVRELILCEPVNPPPANVNFAVVEDVSNPNLRTARQRLEQHANDSSCSGCHKAMDPIGLSLENFDAAGAFRQTENGTAIDPRGFIDDDHFVGAVGLGQALHDNPSTTACMVSVAFRYAYGRPPKRADTDNVIRYEKEFAGSGYRVASLLKAIAMSRSFFDIAPPKSKAAAAGASRPLS